MREDRAKYPIRALVEETPGPWKEGPGPIGSQYGKGPIERASGKMGDTIPGWHQRWVDSEKIDSRIRSGSED